MEKWKSDFKQSYCLHWMESGQPHALSRFTRVKKKHQPLERGLDGPQNRSEQCAKEENACTLHLDDGGSIRPKLL
jgi:hypothetical protein